MRKPLSVTDELLARTWGSGSGLNQFFKRYDTTPESLGLEAYKITDRRWGVRRAGGKNEPPVSDSMSDMPSAAANDQPAGPAPAAAEVTTPDFEEWATQVDELLEREAEEPATEEQLHAMHQEGLQPRDAQQRIIEERANALIADHHEIEPDEVKPQPAFLQQQPVVAQTIADQAQAPHADSPPTPAVTLVHLMLPQSFTLDEAAPIAHRIVRKAGVELVAVDDTHQVVRTYSRAEAHSS